MNFYKNGNYTVCILKDGTKIRKEELNTITDADNILYEYEKGN